MDIFKTVDTFINEHTLIKAGQTIIVGLSGGPDSVFLLHYLVARAKELNLKLIAAHLDHEWRPESAQDAQFCAQLCKQLDVPLITKKMSELDIELTSSGSKEDDARRARRYLFEQLAAEHHADAIALAHQKDDQEETFFIRLLRGTSLTGLVGMWPKKGLYIRPLLCLWKKEIVAWLEQNKIAYVVDPTNMLPDFLRNRIRNTLLPTINEIDPRFHVTFWHTLKRLQQTERFLVKLTKQAFDRVGSFEPKQNRIIIDIPSFLQLDPVLQYRLIVYWLSIEKMQFPVSQSFFDEIIRFLKQPGSKEHSIHPAWKLVKQKNNVFVST